MCRVEDQACSSMDKFKHSLQNLYYIKVHLWSFFVIMSSKRLEDIFFCPPRTTLDVHFAGTFRFDAQNGDAGYLLLMSLSENCVTMLKKAFMYYGHISSSISDSNLLQQCSLLISLRK